VVQYQEAWYYNMPMTKNYQINISVSRILSIPAISVVLALAGCASAGDASPPAPMPRQLEEQVEQVMPHIDPDVVYFVGAAELAGLRDQLQLSAQLYAKAAEISSDPAIAEQAVKVAAYANEQELTIIGVNRWLALRPDHPEPHRVASVLHLRRGDAEQAWVHLKAILDLEPPVEAWAGIVKMLGANPDRDVALTVYRQIAEHYTLPHDESLRQQMSDLGVQLGDMVLAEQFASLTLEVNPENAEAYHWRGRLRVGLDRKVEARTDFEKALELEPDNDATRQSFAALLADLEDFEGAIAELEQVEESLLVLFSKGIYAREAGLDDLAQGFYQEMQAFVVEDQNEKAFITGQLAEALELPYSEVVGWYDQVRSGNRMDTARLRSALLLGKNGELPKAQFILRKLQNGNARTAANAYLAEGGLLRDINRPEEAFSVYDQALILLPEDTNLLFARALLAGDFDRLEIAEGDLRKVLDLSPDNPNALNALGYTLADQTDRYAEALAMIERALDQMPDEPAFVDSMGWVQYKLGNYEEALRFLQRALELQYDSEIAAHLGEVLWVMGRQEEARTLWQEALALEPDSSILKKTVARFASQ
jgi:tetratricopeptide (TPR) repeat protein